MKAPIIYLLFFINFHLFNSACISGGNCPYQQGFCMNNECICINNYWTKIYESQTSPIIYCNYKRTSSLGCLIAEFFVPPLGNILAGYYLYAIIKLVFVLLTCCFRSVKEEMQKMNMSKEKLGFCLIIICIFLIMQITDLLGFLFGYYNDSEGVPLY